MIKLLSSINWVYILAVKVIANRVVRSDTKLTPQHLESLGWINENGFYIEPNIKERDKIWIQFEHHYYRVYHGERKTFISLQSRKEWFDTYYWLIGDSSLRYALAGV